jgi:hypothetical protein
MKVSELKSGYHLFGNKGNVWNNNAHISKSGEPVTMCDTPMLSTNWARIEEVKIIGCSECLEKYNNELKEEDLGPEYDSAGFTEDDRIVNGQYMVIIGNNESIIELFDYPESTQEINNYKELGFEVKIDDPFNDIYSAVYRIDGKTDVIGVLSLMEDCERMGLRPNIDTKLGMFNFDGGLEFINQLANK